MTLICMCFFVIYILKITVVNSIKLQILRYGILTVYFPDKKVVPFMNIDEGRAKPTSLRMSAGNHVAVIVCLISYPFRFCLCLTVVT